MCEIRKLGHQWFLSFVFLIFIIVSSLTNSFAKVINVSIDGAEVVKFEQTISEVFIANPDIADVQLSDKHTLYLFGKSVGSTQIFAMDKNGKEVLNAEIVVNFNLKNFNELISSYDPYGLVEIKSIPGGILLEGPVESAVIAENIRSLAEKYINKSKTSNFVVLNRLTIKPPVQINLRVKVAEVARGVLNQLGVNWQDVISNVGNFKFGFLGNRSPFTAVPILSNDVTSITQPQSVVPSQQVSSM